MCEMSLGMPLTLLSGTEENKASKETSLVLDDGRASVEYYVLQLLRNLEGVTNRREVSESVRLFLNDIVLGLSLNEDSYIRAFAKKALKNTTLKGLQEIALLEQTKVNSKNLTPNSAIFTQLYTLMTTNLMNIDFLRSSIAIQWGLDDYEDFALEGLFDSVGQFASNIWKGKSGEGGIKSLFVGKGAGDNGIKEYSERSVIGKGFAALTGRGKFAESNEDGTTRVGNFLDRIFGSKETRKSAAERTKNFREDNGKNISNSLQKSIDKLNKETSSGTTPSDKKWGIGDLLGIAGSLEMSVWETGSLTQGLANSEQVIRDTIFSASNTPNNSQGNEDNQLYYDDWRDNATPNNQNTLPENGSYPNRDESRSPNGGGSYPNRENERTPQAYNPGSSIKMAGLPIMGLLAAGGVLAFVLKKDRGKKANVNSSQPALNGLPQNRKIVNFLR